MIPTDSEKPIRTASYSKGSAQMPSQPCHPRVLESDSSEDESRDLDEAARDNSYECGSMDPIQNSYEKLTSDERRQKLQKDLAKLREELYESRALENFKEVRILSLIRNIIKM